MSEAPSSMVDRVVLILSIFERSSAEALTAGQISVRSGIPRSSVQRILQQLVSARWLKRHEDGYALGLRMFEIGSLVAHRSRITRAARPFIHELAERTGQVVHLAVLDQQDVVYLDKVASAFADRAFADTLPSRVGGRLPAHCTAVGKALLAYSPRADRQRVPGDGPATADARRAWRRRPHSRRRSSASATRDTRPNGTRPCPVSPASPPRSATSTRSSPRSRSAGRVTRCARKDLPPLVMWTAAEISRSLTTGRRHRSPSPSSPARTSARTSTGGSAAVRRRPAWAPRCHRRRAAPADLHLLSPGAGAGGPRGADAAPGQRLPVPEIARAFLVQEAAMASASPAR